MRDKEYPPLVPNGFKNITETDLHKEFVSPFKNHAQDIRNNLLVGFGSFLNEFKTLNISAEIWIDGSFATEAPDPVDVDAVFYFNLDEIDKLEGETKEKFERLFANKKFMRNLYKVEVYIANSENDEDYKQWQKTFGTCYDEVTPKGIFRIFYK